MPSTGVFGTSDVSRAQRFSQGFTLHASRRSRLEMLSDAWIFTLGRERQLAYSYNSSSTKSRARMYCGSPGYRNAFQNSEPFLFRRPQLTNPSPCSSLVMPKSYCTKL